MTAGVIYFRPLLCCFIIVIDSIGIIIFVIMIMVTIWIMVYAYHYHFVIIGGYCICTRVFIFKSLLLRHEPALSCAAAPTPTTVALSDH